MQLAAHRCDDNGRGGGGGGGGGRTSVVYGHCSVSAGSDCHVEQLGVGSRGRWEVEWGGGGGSELPGLTQTWP